MSIYRICLLALVCLVFSQNSQANPTANLQHTSTPLLISLSENATPTEQYAAEELLRILSLMGESAQILSPGPPSADPSFRILIGTPDTHPAIADAIARWNLSWQNEHEIVIRSEGADLYLVGQHPNTALHATYTLLQDVLGVRWYWPGEDGEYIPQTPLPDLSTLDIRHIPSLKYRFLSLTRARDGYQIDTDIWLARNRMNMVTQSSSAPQPLIEQRKMRGFLLRIAGHNVKIPQETLEAHPEYAALYGGERRLGSATQPPQLCWSNPEVQRLITETIRVWTEEHPQVDLISFYPADITHFCQCEVCLAMARDVSTRWQKFSKIIIDQIKPLYPDKEFGTLAYQAYRNPPSEIADFDQNGYCLYNGCYRHTFSDPCTGNDVPLQEIKEWIQLGGKMGIRGYEFIISRESMFIPLASFVAEQIQYCVTHGLEGWTSEIPPAYIPRDRPREDQRWFSNRLALYLAARMMWDAQITTQEVIQDWHQGIYGPAAPAMVDYYLAMEEAWRSAPGHVTYFLNAASSLVNGFIDQPLVNRAEEAFASARNQIKQTPDNETAQRALKQIELEETFFNKWKELYQIRSGRLQHFQGHALFTPTPPILDARVDNPAWQNAPSLPAFEESKGDPVRDQTETFLLWDQEALYLRLICHDSKLAEIRQHFSKHDDPIWSDDSVELFLRTSADQPGYYHLAVNSVGARYDSLSTGGMNLNSSWNLEWHAVAALGENQWIVDIRLPWDELGINPEEQTEVDLSIKRTRAGKYEDYPNSGWPDASYHNPSALGNIKLVKELPQPLVIYSPYLSADVLQTALSQRLGDSAHVANENELSRLLDQGCRFLIYRHSSSRQHALNQEFAQNHLLPWLERGGLLLFVSPKTSFPDHWFPQFSLNATWSGTGHHPTRRTISLTEGQWMTTPNDLSRIFARGVTPNSGFLNLGTTWQPLATLRLDNHTEAAYLLSARIGQGTLVLTSSYFGFGGRQEIFGESHTHHAALLVENLLAL